MQLAGFCLDVRLLGLGPDIDPFARCPEQYTHSHKRHVPYWWYEFEKRMGASLASVSI